MKRQVILMMMMFTILVDTGCNSNSNNIIESADETTDIIIANESIESTENAENTESAADSISETDTHISETEIAAEEPADETEMVLETNASLPLYEYSGDDGIEKAITEYFREADIYYKPKGAVMIPAFCFFREESTDDDFPVQNDVKVYGNFWMFIYSKRGNTLFCESGGENAGAIYLRKTVNNSYEVTRMDRAADGSYYAEDIKRICDGDTGLEQQFFDSGDATTDPLKYIILYQQHCVLMTKNTVSQMQNHLHGLRIVSAEPTNSKDGRTVRMMLKLFL